VLIGSTQRGQEKPAEEGAISSVEQVRQGSMITALDQRMQRVERIVDAR
jgi:hypothetical protein